MNIVLWLLQVLLALAFLGHGLLFLSPPPEVVAQMNAALPRWFQVFLGAAAGIMIVMISATALHLWRSEFRAAGTTIVLLVMATIVAYFRWRRLPIRPR